VSDAEIDEQEDSSRAGSEESGKEGPDGGDGDRPGSHPYRKPALVVARAIVVLAIAAVGYQEVIPLHHTEVTKTVTSRLSRLAIQQPGVPGFKAKPTSAGVQSTANVGIAALASAAKKSPDKTGLYSIEWSGSAKGSTDGIGVIVFLLPTPADAQAVLGQVSTSVLSSKAQATNSMDRTGTFALPGLSGSAGSVFEPSKKTKTSQDLVVTAWRQGTVVAVVQDAKTTTTAAGAAAAKSEALTVSQAQAKHLASVEPGFTLVEVVRPAGTTHPVLASAVWIVGSVIVALLAGFGPLAVGRARRRRRERLQAELDRLIVVRGQTITKRRR
jgi:hypothetical protein